MSGRRDEPLHLAAKRTGLEPAGRGLSLEDFVSREIEAFQAMRIDRERLARLAHTIGDHARAGSLEAEALYAGAAYEVLASVRRKWLVANVRRAGEDLETTP